MLIATFGPTTGWAGKTITCEDARFVLQDVGPIQSADALRCHAQGQVERGAPEVGDLVSGLACAEEEAVSPAAQAAVTNGQSEEAERRQNRRRPPVPAPRMSRLHANGG